MTKPRHTDTDPGWINRKFKALERQIRELSAAKRLEAATISSGGLTVKDGGGIDVLYPDGTRALNVGPYYYEGANVGSQLMMLEEDGETVIFGIRRASPGPDGRVVTETVLQTRVDMMSLYSKGPVYIVGGDYVMLWTLEGGGVVVDDTVGVTIGHPLGVRIGVDTTSAAANVYIDPVTGRLYRSTSSRRYKQDEAAADIDVDKVLALTPRSFRRKDEVAKHGDDAPTYVGFIAEEAAELGLDDWVTSDDEGPESFSYSSWGVAQQAVLRAQQQQIADLTARLDALERAGRSA